MKQVLVLAVAMTAVAFPVRAQEPPLLPDPVVAALAAELSGESAKRNLEFISRLHRTRGSRPFRAAAEFIVERARAYGLEDVRIEEFPADGKIFYGTQRSRPPWDAEFAELWELRERNGKWVPSVKLGDWDAIPLTLAQDSESADVTADLVDVGQGTAESDYASKDVRGKIALTSSQPEAVQHLAISKYGAVGIVSYAQNQRQAWWGENENLIRWGHLKSFAPENERTFAFMVSLKTARSLRDRLARGETIRLHATVKAGQHPGAYSIPTAAILGADPKLRDEEIVFSCHLDHPRPGANDNASGSVAILEVARTLQKLIGEKKIARPARTIRFVWPPEIEGTVVLLNAKPDWAARIKAAIHMDMVGGGPETKAVFHVTRGPMSLPSFVFDVAEAYAEFVNDQSYEFAATGRASYPLVAPEGGKEPLLAQMAPFSMGSDHQVYTEGSWRIPAIYLNDWPDRYIHTNFDVPANIDPTKLKRAAFIGAATGYFLAKLGPDDIPELLSTVEIAATRRWASVQARSLRIPPAELNDFKRFHSMYNRSTLASVHDFTPLSGPQFDSALGSLNRLLGGLALDTRILVGKAGFVFARSTQLKGPMSVFGYDYFEDKYGEENARKVKLLTYQGLWGSGGEYAYEVLNFVDGKRNAQQIRDAVSAEYGPVPLEYVVEYLRALESIGVVSTIAVARTKSLRLAPCATIACLLARPLRDH